MATEHIQSPSLSFRVGNCPLIERYRGEQSTQPQYRPSRVTTAVVGNAITLEAEWRNGAGNADGCSPVTAKITVPLNGKELDADSIQASVVKSDPFFGEDEPVRLFPDMVNGLLASVDEHSHPEHIGSDTGSSRSNGIALSRYELGNGVARAIEPHVDSRDTGNARLPEVAVHLRSARVLEQFAV